MLAQLLIGVLGVLVITGEYSTGVIRSTLSAVPKRLPVLWAKAGVLAVVTGMPMLVAVFTAFFTGQAILSGDGTGVALTDPGVLRAVLGSVGFLAGVALLGLAIGAIVRNTAGAIGALVAILLLLRGLLGLVLPNGWGDTVVSYLPSNAAAAFTTVNPEPDLLSSGVGLAVFAGYLVVLFGVAAVLLVRRDA
jgi:ABC-2 type transport system permease protein